MSSSVEGAEGTTTENETISQVRLRKTSIGKTNIENKTGEDSRNN